MAANNNDMTKHDLEQHLHALLVGLADLDEGDDQVEVPEELCDRQGGVDMVRTFAEAGVLTTDAGLVLRMKDGTEFQITIVRSR